MSSSLGGRGKKAPYTTTHVRVPDPIKGEVEALISVWRDLIDSEKLSPTEAVTEMYKRLGYATLNQFDAIIEAKRILKQKKSANDSLIKLLQAIYDVDLPKDDLRK